MIEFILIVSVIVNIVFILYSRWLIGILKAREEDIGNLADHVAGTGDTSTGQSKFEISGTTGTGTAGMRILGKYETPKNEFGTNGILEVTIHEHELNQHIDADGTVGV